MVLTVLTVNSLADAAVNLNDATVTLRDAIHAANNDMAVSPGGPSGSGADEIRFQAGLTGTIALNQGELRILSDLSVTGPGAKLLTVSGNHLSGVFYVSDNQASVKTVTISGLTIADGDGFGVANLENLTVANSVISGNEGDIGGGVVNLLTMTVQNSTISGNTALYGGGIAGQEHSTLTVQNSTISGNTAGGGGGGVSMSLATTLTVQNSTITGNHADNDNTGSTYAIGGGIFVFNYNTVVTLHNTIVADNFRGNGTTTEDDIHGFVDPLTISGTNNLIGTGGSGSLTNGVNGNQVGVANPKLDPLADNGGPTKTHALLGGSLAINAGNNAQAPGFSNFDQRGDPFLRIVGGTVDIGAFEAPPPITLVVDTDVDEDDGNYGPSDLSLREAIKLTNTNASAGPDTITFAAGFFNTPRTIVLSLGQLLISDSLTITGPGANLLNVNGNLASRVFEVNDSDTTIQTVTISGLMVAGGNASGISNNENLKVLNSTIRDNFGESAGGIRNIGTLSIVGSTISGNFANSGAGGISSTGGTVSVVNSTISGNSSNTYSGGIGATGTLSVRNSTITSNHADNDNNGTGVGGGIRFGSATVTLHNTIVAGNVRGSGGGFLLTDDISAASGTVSSTSSNNLIGTSGSGGLTNGTNGNQVGVVNAMLGPLANNGGSTLTHALLPGSPAINTGNNAQTQASVTTDQRGSPYPRIVGGTVDIGAFEFAVSLTVNSTADTGDADIGNGICDVGGGICTLRAALQEANALADIQTIRFNIAGSGVKTIMPLSSALPTITDAVIIDGTTQTGFAGAPLIQLDGSSASGANGLYLKGTGSSGSAVQGLAINGFDATGISLSSAAIRVDDGSNGNTISGNYLGLDAGGSTAAGNLFGLHVSTANNTIENNVISGNNRGILLNGGGATGNTVRANLIGTNAGGNASVGNVTDGVKIRGGSGNMIGGPTEADGNVISANFTGVSIFGGSADNNTVQHNLIGTKSTGDGNRGNTVGINLIGTPGTTIKDNVIAGSKRQAIRLIKPDTTDTLIENNLIGLDKSGTVAIGTKYDGIQIANAPGNTIRGNVIANSGFNGIRLLNAGATGNIVQGNLIGTALDGTTPMGNALAGILIKNAPGNQIGGTEPGEGNTISANGEHGILIERPGATNNMIEGNQIGTDIAGTTALGNGSHGIQVDDGTGNVIGGTAAGAGDVIGGNVGAGIAVTGGSATIRGNFIGTDAGGTLDLGNASDGIVANGGLATIGGETAGAGNTIAHNGNNGVKINSGTGNAIHRNSIHDNAALGIDLKPNGPTTNDAGDADDGTNNRQNFPVLTSAVSSGGTTTISGTLNSIASSTFTVEFFSSPTADPSGFGEGQVFLGSTVVDTDGSGNVSFSPAFGVAVTVGHVISATATDANGNTSEFSAAVAVTASSQPASASESLISKSSNTAAGIPADLAGAPLDLPAADTMTFDVVQNERPEGPNRKSKSSNQESLNLLTVVMHEFGHTVGLLDLYDEAAEGDLMYAWLEEGVRNTSLEAWLADHVFEEL